MDDFRIDSHKLMYHVSRVNQWLNGGNIYPIYIEISPSGKCNHRCYFCAFDYLEYRNPFINKDVLMEMLSEAARCGVKSVMYAGEGEPLLHKHIDQLILHAKRVGIDVAVTTNAVFFNDELARQCLASLTWIRASLDAGTKETYAKIHHCHPDDFDLVIENLTNAVKLKRENAHTCSIGVQLLLLPENYREITTLATLLKHIGVDYLIIKPFSKHPMSYAHVDSAPPDSDLRCLREELQQLSSDKFKIIFRYHTMEKLWNGKRAYGQCLGLPFFAYIDSNGNIYACSAYLGDDRFCYGNIYENFFSEIWNGERRRKVLETVENELDVAQCREVCRLDEINTYLWELKHPPPHVNFI